MNKWISRYILSYSNFLKHYTSPLCPDFNAFKITLLASSTVIISPSSLNPDVIVEREEIRKVIVEAINELPEKEKMVIVLYYHEDLTFKEIGQVLEVSESRISQLHTRANLRLRAKLTNLRKGIM